MTLVVWSITCLIWGTVWLFIKLGLSDLPPLSFAAYRQVIAVAVLLPIVAVRRVPLPRTAREWKLIVWSGLLLLGLNYVFVYWGAQFISSGLTAVLQAVTPAFSLLLAHFWTRQERITRLKVAGLALGVGGVALVFSDQLSIGGTRGVLGCAAIVASVACVAIAYVVVKARGTHLDPMVMALGQMLAAVGPLLVLALVVDGSPQSLRWTRAAVVSLLYLSLAGSVLAFWLNYWLLQRMSATALLVMGIVEPLIAVVLGAIVLDESMPPGSAAGAVAILASATMMLGRDAGQRAPPDP